MTFSASNIAINKVTTSGTQANPATDANGNPSKYGFYGATPAAQPTSAGNVHTVTSGATTAVYVNTTFDGSIGTTAYTVGDLVKALKTLGLIAS